MLLNTIQRNWYAILKICCYGFNYQDLSMFNIWDLQRRLAMTWDEIGDTSISDYAFAINICYKMRQFVISNSVLSCAII